MSKSFLITTELLEQAVDKDGAWNVMIALELVLGDKAMHIRANWQDKHTARVYDKFSLKAGKLARELEKANI